MELNILSLDSVMLPTVSNSLKKHNIHRTMDYFEKCLGEQTKGIRNTMISFIGDQPVGVVHLLYNSLYPGFAANSIPEINDLVVVKEYQWQGIGERLIKACEDLARQKGYTTIGMGVGLYEDYGSAQRLYFRLGYKPDGKGLMYCNKPVPPGTSVLIDDDLLIYLIKGLRE